MTKKKFQFKKSNNLEYKIQVFICNRNDKMDKKLKRIYKKIKKMINNK